MVTGYGLNEYPPANMGFATRGPHPTQGDGSWSPRPVPFDGPAGGLSGTPADHDA